jgi:hypothetical protein
MPFRGAATCPVAGDGFRRRSGSARHSGSGKGRSEAVKVTCPRLDYLSLHWGRSICADSADEVVCPPCGPCPSLGTLPICPHFLRRGSLSPFFVSCVLGIRGVPLAGDLSVWPRGGGSLLPSDASSLSGCLGILHFAATRGHRSAAYPAGGLRKQKGVKTASTRLGAEPMIATSRFGG